MYFMLFCVVSGVPVVTDWSSPIFFCLVLSILHAALWKMGEVPVAFLMCPILPVCWQLFGLEIHCARATH